MWSVLHIQTCILWAIYQSQFSEWVVATISPPILLNSYIWAIWTIYLNQPTKSNTFGRCSSTMTGLLVLTIWKRHSPILPCKASKILTVQNSLTYYLLLINGEILAEPIFYTFSLVWRSNFSDSCQQRYIIWDKVMSAKCAEVSIQPHSKMHQKMVDFPTLDDYSVTKLKRTVYTKLEHWWTDMIRMYSLTLYWINFRMGCGTTVDHFTALNLLSIWELIAW